MYILEACKPIYTILCLKPKYAFFCFLESDFNSVPNIYIHPSPTGDDKIVDENDEARLARLAEKPETL